MKQKIPNIVIIIVVGVLLMLGVYLYFRTREKIDEQKSREAGNWFTNLFS
jgi:uncharacterized membrane protein YidH (DUF202 family)